MSRRGISSSATKTAPVLAVVLALVLTQGCGDEENPTIATFPDASISEESDGGGGALASPTPKTACEAYITAACAGFARCDGFQTAPERLCLTQKELCPEFLFSEGSLSDGTTCATLSHIMSPRYLAATSVSISLLAGCAATPTEDVAAGEGASTVDVSQASVSERLSDALVGKSMVTTSDVSFSSGSDHWAASVGLTLPAAAKITASNGKAAGNLFCTLVIADGGADLVSRSLPKGAAHTIASVKPHLGIADWYDLTFTDPDTKTASNFTGLCVVNIPFTSNATLL